MCLYLCWKPSKACMIFDRIFPYCMSLWQYITINRPCLWLTRGLIWSMQTVLNIYRFNIQNAKGSISVVFGGRRVLWGVCLPVCRFGKCIMYQACLCARHAVYCYYLFSLHLLRVMWQRGQKMVGRKGSGNDSSCTMPLFWHCRYGQQYVHLYWLMLELFESVTVMFGFLC